MDRFPDCSNGGSYVRQQPDSMWIDGRDGFVVTPLQYVD